MNKNDLLKLKFSRNWNFPGQERLASYLKPSNKFQKKFKNAISWLTDENIAIFASPDNYIEYTILSRGSYEEEIGRLIAISLSEGDIALDIGGNIGLHSLRMARYAGSRGKVIAFEPLKHLRDKFERNIKLNGLTNILLLPYALSDSEGNVNFTVNSTKWNQGTFSLSQKETGGEVQKVQIKIGDQLKEIETLDRLSLIKIDVEGFELSVLKGLRNTLLRFYPRIIFEYDQNYWSVNGFNIKQGLHFLRDLNYSIYQITEIGCTRIEDDEIKSGNIFCLID